MYSSKQNINTRTLLILREKNLIETMIVLCFRPFINKIPGNNFMICFTPMNCSETQILT
jgi:hypothetical protein